MCEDEFKRMQVKLGEGLPTIPVSADHRNGDWIDTDIYEGEFYQDTLTGIIYNRSADSITKNGSIETTVNVPFASVLNLDGIPFLLATPPSGYAIKLTSDPIIKTFSNGTDFFLAFGSLVNIVNTSIDTPVMSSFDHFAIIKDGIYTGYNKATYELVVDSSIYLTVDAPITDGAGGGYLEIRFLYELVSY